MRYGRYKIAAHLYFWLPTSILFLLSRVGLAATFRLAAIYFLAVVVLEIPSGWLSDRFGRVLTLRIAALSWLVAFSTFLMAGSSFAWLAVAQVFLALGQASRSGTDSSFHYDTLEALDRAAEFEQREARAARNGFLGTTVVAAIGGALGLIDLALPYVAALVAAGYELMLTLRMVEPPPAAGLPARAHRESPGQIRATLRYLRRPGLAWLMVYMALQQPLEGLALDLIQPWLTEVTGGSFADPGLASLYSGVIIAAISIVGAAAAAKSHQLRRAAGLRGALIILASIEALLLVGMAIVMSPWLIPLLAMRSAQPAVAPVLTASAASPHLAKHHRATFLSMGSVFGRMLYGFVLIALGFIDELALVLTASALIGVVSVLILVAAGRVFGRDDLEMPTPAV